MKKKGFTIIEIMIVATIIMFISGFGLATYNEISRNSRDAKRQSDLDVLRNAVELYKNSDETTSSYPKNLLIIPTKYPMILKSIPQDPKKNDYVYKALPENCNGTTIPCVSYTITAESEKVTNAEFLATANSIILTSVTPTIIGTSNTPIPPTATPVLPTNTPPIATTTPTTTITPTPIINVGCNLSCSMNSQCASNYCYSVTNTCRNITCPDYSDCTCPAPTSTPIVPTSTPNPPTSTPIVPTTTPIIPTATPIPPTATPIVPTSTPNPPTATPTPSQHTITVAINSGNNDAYQGADINARVYATLTDLKLGWPISKAGLRFTDAQFANISQKTIVNASISFSANVSANSALSMRYYGEKVTNCSVFAEVQNNIGARSLTTNYSSWSVSANWSEGQIYSSPSLTTVIQEIVNQSSYSGGAICILISEVSSATYYERKISSYEHSTYQEPRLTITYLQ